MADDDRITELQDEYGDLLTPWEENFLDSLENWEGDLTSAQEAKLEQIYEEVPQRRRKR